MYLSIPNMLSNCDPAEFMKEMYPAVVIVLCQSLHLHNIFNPHEAVTVSMTKRDSSSPMFRQTPLQGKSVADPSTPRFS